MDWFEEWFDSPLYEKLYANRDEEEAARLVQFLVEMLPLEKCSNILDLGCGRGRHAINLNQEGYDVTGIDLSEEAISTARNKAGEMNLEHIRFEVRDMRNPLSETFDAIVNLFTTFGYFQTDEENIKVLESVKNMLKPEGIFVLDYLNASRVKKTYVASDEGKFQDINYRIERYLKNGAIHKDISFERASTGNRKSYSERVKLYDLEWFKEAMSKNNLHIDHIYGDYKGSGFDVEKSPRLLIISHLK